MREYELLFIVKTEIPEEGTQEVIDRYSKVLTDHGAEVTAVDEWGKRRLAYVIDKKYTDGVYVLIKFNGDSAAVNEVDRLMKIDERLLRHLVTRVGE